MPELQDSERFRYEEKDRRRHVLSRVPSYELLDDKSEGCEHMTKNLKDEKTIDDLMNELDVFQEHLETFHDEKTIEVLKGLYGVNKKHE